MRKVCVNRLLGSLSATSFFLTVVTVHAIGALAQSQPAVDPEVLGRVFSADPTTGALKQLPIEHWTRKAKHGMMHAESLVIVNGPRSGFRIPASSNISFVFRPVPTAMGNSNTGVQNVRLFAFDRKKERRECLMAEGKAGWAHVNTERNPGISMDIVAYGSSSFKFTPRTPLAPGEYWIGAGPGDIATFGVD